MEMSNEWPQRTVHELQQDGILLVEDGNHGENRPRPDEFGEGEVSFIRAADMADGRVLFDTAQRINETAVRRIRKGIGYAGDILLSHKGTVGKVAFVPSECPPFVCSPQTTFWRTLDQNKIDRRFLYAFLCSLDFRKQLDARANETDMAGYVSLTAQRTFEVPLPPIDVQRFIGRILGSLDDKIELNRRMNATLESMAQAIFKSWFIDFDPVHRNAAVRLDKPVNSYSITIFDHIFWSIRHYRGSRSSPPQ
jgi:type I restriction enzyme S subunit